MSFGAGVDSGLCSGTGVDSGETWERTSRLVWMIEGRGKSVETFSIAACADIIGGSANLDDKSVLLDAAFLDWGLVGDSGMAAMIACDSGCSLTRTDSMVDTGRAETRELGMDRRIMKLVNLEGKT